jgi:heme exporter protein D
MASFTSYFAMGGYAGYIWSAWGLTALVMAALAVASWRALKSSQRELKTLQDLYPGRRGRIWGEQDQ